MDIKKSRLYAITSNLSSNFYTYIRDLCKGGVDIVQFRGAPGAVFDRDKLEIAKTIRKITKEYGVLFIVNDRIDLALLSEADGVHLGQEDIPIIEIRKLSKKIIIGRSTHSLEQAVLAEDEGADYVGIGPLRGTPTKPTYQPIGIDIIKKVINRISIPAFAIGGIGIEDISNLMSYGIKRVAVVRALTMDTAKNAGLFKDALKG